MYQYAPQDPLSTAKAGEGGAPPSAKTNPSSSLAGGASGPPMLPCTSTQKWGKPRPASQAGPPSSLSMAIVEALPATTQRSPTTLTEAKWRTGHPVLGLRI